MVSDILGRLTKKVEPNTLYEWVTVEICPKQAANLAKLKTLKRLKKSEVVQLALDQLFASASPDDIERMVQERRG
ncbi:hypothetical protein [Methanomassiliicoccus luminyensis]|uniref:hypothetical protein n=1 Tax=Methanomassiliicoccus luminyensis TaxID=1080712 RepID=UPI00037F1F0C|nr:hypothetical protein [Methanomassiliicoccus luminyensis]